MCTELFLALIYFLIIFLVNFFLIKLVIKSIQATLYLIKIQNICLCFKDTRINNLWLFLNLIKIKTTKLPTLIYLNKIKNTKDILIIGKTYQYLNFVLTQNKLLENKNNFYYLLLTNQYLDNKKI